MDWLRKALFGNWWLKLLSLGLAYALWSAVTYTPVADIGVSVPIELHNLPANLQVAGGFSTRVHLQLRGPENRLRRLTPEQIAVVVDLREATPGKITLHLSAQNVEVPSGIEVVRILPEEIWLELAPR